MWVQLSNGNQAKNCIFMNVSVFVKSQRKNLWLFMMKLWNVDIKTWKRRARTAQTYTGTWVWYDITIGTDSSFEIARAPNTYNTVRMENQLSNTRYFLLLKLFFYNKKNEIVRTHHNARRWSMYDIRLELGNCWDDSWAECQRQGYLLVPREREAETKISRYYTKINFKRHIIHWYGQDLAF